MSKRKTEFSSVYFKIERHVANQDLLPRLLLSRLLDKKLNCFGEILAEGRSLDIHAQLVLEGV